MCDGPTARPSNRPTDWVYSYTKVSLIVLLMKNIKKKNLIDITIFIFFFVSFFREKL